METAAVVSLAFFSGVLLVVLVTRLLFSERGARPLAGTALFISLFAACLGFVAWLGLVDVILGFLANTAETRDRLGRVFLAALTVGLAVATLYRRYRGSNGEGPKGSE
jgi:hypothetical protein